MPHSLGRFPVLFVLAALLFATAAGGCGLGGGPGRSAVADSTTAGQEKKEDDGPDYPYHVYVRGMLTDTLSGRVEFGKIFDPETRREQWVLSMRAGGDVTSGVYLARPDTSRPQTGTYQIVERKPVGESNSTRPPGTDSFTMIYRAGMRRSFHSQSGTLKLTTASDTLIEGTFQATLDGSASLPGQPPRKGTVTVRGDFRAEKAIVGFVFGV